MSREFILNTCIIFIENKYFLKFLSKYNGEQNKLAKKILKKQ